MKITSLVAVLALCCAALAGSAYAYSATYVDTIDSQDIEDVFMVVSAVEGEVGANDVDVQYNTFNNGEIANEKPVYYYQLDMATIADNEESAMTKNVTAKTAKICLLVDTVTIKAYGDAARLTKLEISATTLETSSAAASAKGITASLILSKESITSIDEIAEKGKEFLSYEGAEGDIGLGADDKIVAYAYLVIDVNQLDGTAGPTGYTDYFTSTKIGNVTIDSFTVAYKATAGQKPTA